MNSNHRIYRINRGRTENGSLVVAAEQTTIRRGETNTHRPIDLRIAGKAKIQVQKVFSYGVEDSDRAVAKMANRYYEAINQPFEVWAEYLSPVQPSLAEQELGRPFTEAEKAARSSENEIWMAEGMIRHAEENLERGVERIAETLRYMAAEIEREATYLRTGASGIEVLRRVMEQTERSIHTAGLVADALKVDENRREYGAKLSCPWEPSPASKEPGHHAFAGKYGDSMSGDCSICEQQVEAHTNKDLFQRPVRRGY